MKPWNHSHFFHSAVSVMPGGWAQRHEPTSAAPTRCTYRELCIRFHEHATSVSERSAFLRGVPGFRFCISCSISTTRRGLRPQKIFYFLDDGRVWTQGYGVHPHNAPAKTIHHLTQ